MGKVSELDMAISDLRKAAAAINDVADTLAGMFSGAATEEAPEPPSHPGAGQSRSRRKVPQRTHR